MAFSLSKKARLSIIIAISMSFFIAEITVAFKTRSLALLADAFHYVSRSSGYHQVELAQQSN